MGSETSFPGCISTTLPSGHCYGGTLSSLITTRSPMAIAFCFLDHFDRFCSSCNYSSFHLFQKSCLTLYICFHLVICPGDAVSSPPIKKCPGVRGRDFSNASMSITTVFNSSYVKDAHTMRTNKCFDNFTAASQSPPN